MIKDQREREGERKPLLSSEVASIKKKKKE